jgi:protein phosphatase
MSGKMDVYGLTDPGKVRGHNEDQYLIADLSKSMRVHRTSLDLDEQTRLFGPSQGQLLLVADGLGGEAAGERASRLAVDALTAYVLNTMHWFFRLREDSEEQFADDLRAALQYCQAQIRAEAARLPQQRGMGTTLTLAYLIWPRLFVVHAGDSRCYLLRQGRLWRVTRDHTVAQRLAEEGVLQDPEHSTLSHVLWNVLGDSDDELVPEVYRGELDLGDTLLLCTDGLTKHMSDAELTRLLAADEPSEQTCRRLVAAANAAGGTDNITVVVAHFRDARQQQAVAEAAAAQPMENEAARPPQTADAREWPAAVGAAP